MPHDGPSTIPLTSVLILGAKIAQTSVVAAQVCKGIRSVKNPRVLNGSNKNQQPIGEREIDLTAQRKHCYAVTLPANIIPNILLADNHQTVPHNS